MRRSVTDFIGNITVIMLLFASASVGTELLTFQERLARHKIAEAFWIAPGVAEHLPGEASRYPVKGRLTGTKSSCWQIILPLL